MTQEELQEMREKVEAPFKFQKKLCDDEKFRSGKQNQYKYSQKYISFCCFIITCVTLRFVQIYFLLILDYLKEKESIEKVSYEWNKCQTNLENGLDAATKGLEVANRICWYV